MTEQGTTVGLNTNTEDNPSDDSRTTTETDRIASDTDRPSTGNIDTTTAAEIIDTTTTAVIIDTTTNKITDTTTNKSFGNSIADTDDNTTTEKTIIEETTTERVDDDEEAVTEDYFDDDPGMNEVDNVEGNYGFGQTGCLIMRSDIFSILTNWRNKIKVKFDFTLIK